MRVSRAGHLNCSIPLLRVLDFIEHKPSSVEFFSVWRKNAVESRCFPTISFPQALSILVIGNLPSASAKFNSHRDCDIVGCHGCTGLCVEFISCCFDSDTRTCYQEPMEGLTPRFPHDLFIFLLEKSIICSNKWPFITIKPAGKSMGIAGLLETDNLYTVGCLLLIQNTMAFENRIMRKDEKWKSVI